MKKTTRRFSQLAILASCAILLLTLAMSTAQASLNSLEVGGNTMQGTPAELPPAASHSGGLQFNFVVAPGSALDNLLNGTPAQMLLGNNVLNGFDEAAHLWSAAFKDPIQVNVQIDFPTLGSGILGQASSSTIGVTYPSLRSALNFDASTAADALAVSNLQTASSLDMMTNNTAVAPFSPRVRDNDGSANNRTISINTANAKALQLLPATAQGNDASISFSSNFSWDFNRGNGITSGQYDFVGVATHEIGHALGFVSGVDAVDFYGGFGPGAPLDLDNFRVFSVLDLYRYSNDSTSQPNQPAAGAVLDLAYGEVPGDTPYFSIDGGVTPLATFSTGSFNGDGWQASHWEDNLGIGIMDPTLSSGTVAIMTQLDLKALDVIGYNRVPEPSVLLLLAAAGLVGFTASRR